MPYGHPSEHPKCMAIHSTLSSHWSELVSRIALYSPLLQISIFKISNQIPVICVFCRSSLSFFVFCFTTFIIYFYSVQFSSVTQLCLTLCDPMNHSASGLPVHHQLPESTQTHVHWVGDAIQPSHPLSSPSPPTPNPSQHHSLFQWVNSSHEMAKVLEFQL